MVKLELSAKDFKLMKECVELAIETEEDALMVVEKSELKRVKDIIAELRDLKTKLYVASQSECDVRPE